MDVDIRGWMQEGERLFLKRLAFGRRVLELGAYEGLSTISMAMTAKHVTTVDTFDGRATASPAETLSKLLQHLDDTGLRPKVTVCKGLTSDVLPTLTGPFDLIFIDADHSYEAVKSDIALSVRLLSPDGIIAFHDYDDVHDGVVRAVNELTAEGGWKNVGQENAIVAMTKGNVEAGGTITYVVMPHRDHQVHLGSAKAMYFATLGKSKRIHSDGGTSVLTYNFNALFCEALNARMTDGVTHFAMLHNDVVPPPGWLDTLHAEMEAGGYDCVSAVVPLKNKKGLTSTGLDTPGNPWAVRRLSLAEVFKLPETFTAADIPYAEGGILLNTGCWLMKIPSEPLCFRQQDMIAWVPAEGKFLPFSITEDWDFSRQLIARGAKIAATRKVRLYHGQPEFHNYEPWGLWERDEDFCAGTLKVQPAMSNGLIQAA